MKLAEKKELYNSFIEEQKQYEDGKNKYFELSFKIDKLGKEIRKEDQYNELNTVSYITDFEDCDYPSMGSAGSDGKAEFKNEEEANRLVKALRMNANYEHAYLLEWTIPGTYKMVPSYKRDHDGDTIYTATFKKA